MASQSQRQNRQPPKTKLPKRCRFFNSLSGCKNDSCPFLHIPNTTDASFTNDDVTSNSIRRNHSGSGIGSVNNNSSTRSRNDRRTRNNDDLNTGGNESRIHASHTSKSIISKTCTENAVQAGGQSQRPSTKNMSPTSSSEGRCANKSKQQMKKCRNGNKCKTKNCRFVHPQREGMESQSVSLDLSEDVNGNAFTNTNKARKSAPMTISESNAGPSKTCTFAPTSTTASTSTSTSKATGRKKTRCKYGSKCRAKSCKFLHPLDATSTKNAFGCGDNIVNEIIPIEMFLNETDTDAHSIISNKDKSAPEGSAMHKNTGSRKKVRKCKFKDKCSNLNCKFEHPSEHNRTLLCSNNTTPQNASFTATTSENESRNTRDMSQKHKATEQHIQERPSTAHAKNGNRHELESGPRSRSTSRPHSQPLPQTKTQAHTRSRSKSKKMSQLQHQPQSQPQFTDSNIDQMFFGEGSNELWNNLDHSDIASLPSSIPQSTAGKRSAPAPTTSAINSKEHNNNCYGRRNANAVEKGNTTSVYDLEPKSQGGNGVNKDLYEEDASTSRNNLRQNHRSSNNKRNRFRREQERAERLQREEKESIRVAQEQYQQQILHTNPHRRKAKDYQEKTRSIEEKQKSVVQDRLKERARLHTEKEEADAIARAKSAAMKRTRVEAAAREKTDTLARVQAESEAEAKKKIRDQAEAEAREEKAKIIKRSQAEAEAKIKAEKDARIAKERADDKARALAEEKMKAEARELAEEKTKAAKIKREQQELARAKARKEAKLRRDREKIEEEKRNKAHEADMAQKVKAMEEKKAARAKKLRDEKEAARAKKLKNDEKRSNKARQIKEERLKFWETDINQRVEFMHVMRKFLTADALRITGCSDLNQLEDVQLAIENEGSMAYANLYRNLVVSKVKIFSPKNKQIHNRFGTILGWDTSKKKYKVGLETKKRNMEIIFVPAENLEVTEGPFTCSKKQNTKDVVGLAEVTIRTPFGELAISRDLVDKLRLIYRLDENDLDSKISIEMNARTESDRVARIHREKEMKEREEAARREKARIAQEQKERRERQAAADERYAREYRARARQKAEARRAASRGRRGQSNHFSGGFPGDFPPFGSMGGMHFGGGGPSFSFGIGPDGRPFIVIEDDSDEYDNEEYFNHEDYEDEQGPTKEEHAAALRVSVEASTKEIKSAYRKMALTYHPDKYKTGKVGDMTKEEAEEYFKKAAAAYEYFMERS